MGDAGVRFFTKPTAALLYICLGIYRNVYNFSCTLCRTAELIPHMFYRIVSFVSANQNTKI